jgi:acetylornithine deacetylase
VTASATARERALDAVDAAASGLVELVSRTVRAASVSGSEDLVAPVYAGWLADAGFSVEQRHVDAEALPGERLDGEPRLARQPNVYGWLRPPSGRPIVALNGHMDVVPPGDGWVRDPFGGEVDGERVWGRGTADMKGGLAAGMVAARALLDAGVDLGCDVVVQCVVAEETGGLGTRFALASEPRPAAAIVLEPTDCMAVSASGGVTPFAVEVGGRAAHTSVPWTGASAFERLEAVHAVLAEHTREREAACEHPLFARLPAPAALAIGTMRAGEHWGMVPDRARMEGRVGVLPGETVAAVRDGLCDRLERLAESEGWPAREAPRVTFPVEGFPSWETPADQPVVAGLRAACLEVLGDERAGVVTYGSDAAAFAASGIPVALFGPGRIADAHTKDEFVEIRQLRDAARVLAIALLECSARIATGEMT